MSSVLRSRRITALLSGVGALCLLAACNTAGSQPGGGKSGSTLVYWSMWKEGEPQQKVLQESLDQFTEETGIKVQVQWAGRQVLQQVVPRLNSGNPPDLTDQDGTSLHAVLGEGALGLQDVYDAQITGETQKVSDIIPAPLVASAKKADGQPMLVPYEVVTGSRPCSRISRRRAGAPASAGERPSSPGGNGRTAVPTCEAGVKGGGRGGLGRVGTSAAASRRAMSASSAPTAFEPTRSTDPTRRR
ncbi:hypothetical protein AB0R12_05505 [Streptomyces niveus]|uniref:hypothetical protein n=1 Tax=Streptomyces niveus TaxID=193462 RepID=UPI0034162C90